MKAVLYGGPGIITVENRPIPVVENDLDVVIRVTATGLCGSDLHLYRGLESYSPGYVLGHEFCGYIHSVGPAIKNFKVGDKVLSPFTVSCGECWYCEKGYSSRCAKSLLFGSNSLDGGQADYVKVPLADSTLILAPSELPDELLVAMGDIMPTGYHASKNAFKYLPESERKDAVVVVVGVGPVGICAVASASEWVQKGNLYAVDSVKERLDQAERFGAIPIDLNAIGEASALEIIRKKTDGRGADAVLEVVGLKPAYDLALTLVRPFGVISSVGVHNDPSLLSGPSAYDKNLRACFGRCPVRTEFAEALEVLRRQKNLFLSEKEGEGFVSHFMALEDAPEAYRLFDQRKVRKVVFRPNHPAV